MKPFPFGNSIGHLVLHLTGNLNHYIGAMIAGTGYVREREQEFTDPDHPPVGELLKAFHEAVAMVVADPARPGRRIASRCRSSTTCRSSPGWDSFSSALHT